MPRTPKPNDTLLSYIRVQKDHDRRMYALLNRSASDIDRDLRRLADREGIGAIVRREQLLAAKKQILIRLSEMMTNAGYVIQALKYESAAAAIETFKRYDRMLMRAVADEDLVAAYLRSAEETSKRGIEVAEQRVLGASYRPLAESVYDTQQLNAGVVDRYVETALARGLSAREFAKGAVDLVKPNVAGGVSYSTLRLGRTEINNAFHSIQAKKARDTPWVEGVIWHLSGSHPKPDECNDYAANTVAGHEEQGFFLPDDIPAKPHPQCLCFTTPATNSEDAWLDAYFAGEYDTYLSSVR